MNFDELPGSFHELPVNFHEFPMNFHEQKYTVSLRQVKFTFICLPDACRNLPETFWRPSGSFWGGSGSFREMSRSFPVGSGSFQEMSGSSGQVPEASRGFLPASGSWSGVFESCTEVKGKGGSSTGAYAWLSAAPRLLALPLPLFLPSLKCTRQGSGRVRETLEKKRGGEQPRVRVSQRGLGSDR